MDEKLNRGALSSSTVTTGDIDFSQTKLLRDRLGNVIPQVWDEQNHTWIVATMQNTGGNGGGEAGSVTWDSIQEKPSAFTPSAHTHEISEIAGLQEKLDEIMNALQGDSGENLTWLEICKVDDYDCLTLENFDATNSNYVEFGEGFIKTTKPENPAVLNIPQKPVTFTIKLKEEYKNFYKSITPYAENGTPFTGYYDEDFDENGQIVLRYEDGYKNPTNKIFIRMYFENLDILNDYVEYWVDVIIGENTP